MQNFRLWYQEWIQVQELTITRLEVAEAAFDAGVKSVLSAGKTDKQEPVDGKEINTLKGNF